MKIKKTIAAVAAAAMVFTSVPMVAFADTHTCGSFTYTNITATQHTAKCGVAECDQTSANQYGHADGKTEDHATQNPKVYGKDATRHWEKCACGAEVTGTNVVHTFSKSGVDADKAAGMLVCACGEKKACASHTWSGTGASVTVDGNTITVRECSDCGYKESEACTHTNKTWTDDGASHSADCADCGATDVATHPETTADSEVKTSTTQHWTVCKKCGVEIVAKAGHDWALSGTTTATKHGYECTTCGATKEEDHGSFTYTDKAGETHVKTCGTCLKVFEPEAHKFEWASTKATCVCGTDEPAESAHEHDANKWIVSSDDHVTACSVCGKPVASDAEGYKTHPAVLDYASDADGHWQECQVKGCTFKTDKAAHGWGTGDNANKCTTCNYVKTTTPEQKPEDKPEQKPEQKPEETTPTTPAESSSSSSSSSSSGGAVSGNAGTVPTVSSASDMRTSNNTNVNIKASETKVTPAIVNAFVKNKKTKTMTITYSNKLRVAVSKSDIKGTPALDFSVSGNKFLSSKIMSNSTLAKAKTVVQIDFVNKGKIDGVDKVTVQSRVGGKYAGEKATVYEYSNGKLVKVATAKVGGSGLVSFKVDHLGQYVVVVG